MKTVEVKKKPALVAEDAAVFLTPGSVWLRDDGSKSTLLFVTNTSLPPKVQAKFPSQAVYLDEEGNVLNRSVAEFIANRTFHNVVADVETLVEGLLAYRDLDSIAEDEGTDDDAIEIDEEAGEDDELLIAGDDDDAELVAEAQDDLEAEIEDDDSDVLVKLDVPADASDSLKAFAPIIEDAIVGYRQEPVLSHSLIAHVLIIDTRLIDASVEEIMAAFDPDNSPNLIPSFKVRGLPRVAWNTFMGTYMQLTDKKFYLSVYLGIDMDTVEEKIPSSSVDAEMIGLAAAVSGEPATGEAAVAEGPVTVDVVDPDPAPGAEPAPNKAPEVAVAVAVAVAEVAAPAPTVVVLPPAGQQPSQAGVRPQPQAAAPVVVS